QVWQAHFPAAFASAGVGLAIVAAGWALAGTPSLAVLMVQITAGALALAFCIRLCPAPAVRAELWLRLVSAGLLEASGGWRWRLARLVLGKPDQSLEPQQRDGQNQNGPAPTRRNQDQQPNLDNPG
ncbi:MAG TPA: hypothetical protein VFO87_09110, partial [Nitrospira sp.]|nr:hypothetical protein [Nitrospira sp.]